MKPQSKGGNDFENPYEFRVARRRERDVSTVLRADCALFFKRHLPPAVHPFCLPARHRAGDETATWRLFIATWQH